MPQQSPHTLVIGAGFGGLAAAIRRAAAGDRVTMLEAAAEPGGKARAVPSAAGPVDAGPTVLTMRWVFDDLAKAAGVRLDDHVTLTQEPVVARHFWPDGTTLDLFSDPEASREAISAFAGPEEAKRFLAFRAEAETLFETFREPMMETAEPRLTALARAALTMPRSIGTLLPRATMARHLARRFHDPRLAQLFGRYATYVGGSPNDSPALLSLIWRAEEHGVWRVEGGMHCLAAALAGIARDLGSEIRCDTPVERIDTREGRVAAVVTRGGERIVADRVVFAGDPRALRLGLVGDDVKNAVADYAVEPRSLSARVWSFAARVNAPELLHHNVFFGSDPRSEFGPISAGRPPEDPTLYICAEDRGAGRTPPALERFEIIENAAPVVGEHTEEAASCRTRVFRTLVTRGVCFDPVPDIGALTTPEGFAALFPGSAGSLYGRSPHGATAALRRPRARTAVPGLFLAGGGAHPGAGVPMAALSGKHAAETIGSDRTSTSVWPRTATRGGTSTASRTMAPARSPSSPS